jgi:hypothetical protein
MIRFMLSCKSPEGALRISNISIMPSDLPHGKMLRRETLKISATWKAGSVLLTVPRACTCFRSKSSWRGCLEATGARALGPSPGVSSVPWQHVTKACVKDARVRGGGVVRGRAPGIVFALCVTGRIPGLVNAKSFVRGSARVLGRAGRFSKSARSSSLKLGTARRRFSTDEA